MIKVNTARRPRGLVRSTANVLILYATTEGQTGRIAELVRLFVRVAGGDTDSSRNYEYTDWDAVAKFADAVSAQA